MVSEKIVIPGIVVVMSQDMLFTVHMTQQQNAEEIQVSIKKCVKYVPYHEKC